VDKDQTKPLLYTLTVDTNGPVTAANLSITQALAIFTTKM